MVRLENMGVDRVLEDAKKILGGNWTGIPAPM
jgi:hypothetical protein